MSTVYQTMLSLHDLLHKICEVESDVLDGSLKSLFRKKDFSGNGEKLASYTQSLQSTLQDLQQSNSSDEDVIKLIQVATDYCNALLSSTMVLGKLNSALMCKARGLPYSLGDYNRDLDLFRNLQNQYLSFGGALNQAFQVCREKL